MQNRSLLGVVLLAALLALGYLVVRPFWAPLAWAAILAYLTTPIYRRILRLLEGRPSLAASVATTLVLTLLLVPFLSLLLRLPRELSESYREISSAFDEPLVLPEALTHIPVLGPVLDETLTGFWNDPEVRKQQVKEWLEPWSREIASLVGGLGRSVAQLAVAVVALFFLYRDGESALGQIRRALHKIVGEMADKYFQAIGATTRAVVFGLLVSALAQGFLAGVGYQIFGIGAPILLGAATAVAAVIPFVGAVSIWAPVALWMLLSGRTGAGLALLAWGAVIVNPTDNILKPLLISGATDIPLALVFIGVMGGLMAFGLVGLFLGPLVLAVLLAIWREWLEEDRGADMGVDLEGK
ncbi:AI-2E family transporter [Methylocystis heyeri]|uniref:AI-2E family transporter n=1 Tax=Methylocystis heyeri TaxID=391905 RepID=A0A6B8KHH6_9HYPH|nr:AI-2E family transporter [Methylocystis heyeri]QGM45958.1 AI-2E family transporter [Methylocystis heyeri]